MKMVLQHPPFRVQIWCDDCCGQDFDGCFDGASEILGTSFDLPKGKEYSSLDEAVNAGNKWFPGKTHPWRFRVIDSLGLDVREQYRDKPEWLHSWNAEEAS